MEWQQKAAALEALSEINIKCRGAGDWYVSQRVEVKDGSMLIGAYGNGETPEAAIIDHWRKLVEEIGSKYLVTRDEHRKRRAVRWNGFMWMDVREPDQVAA